MQRPLDQGGESWAADAELAGEIELYGDLVVAASSQEAPLTPVEIDSVLGLDEDAPDRASRHASRDASDHEPRHEPDHATT